MLTSAVDELARSLGQRDGDVEAHRVADDDRALDLELVERLGDRCGLVVDLVAARRLLRAAEAEQVDADHAVVLRQQRRHLVPPVERAGVAVQEHDRRAPGSLGRSGPCSKTCTAPFGSSIDAAAVDVHLGGLGLVVDDDRVDREQHRQRRR